MKNYGPLHVTNLNPWLEKPSEQKFIGNQEKKMKMIEEILHIGSHAPDKGVLLIILDVYFFSLVPNGTI
jgi:hypothetical protein